jgi:hypothetical protein
MSDENLKGFRQVYQETGHMGYGGGPGEKTIDAGPSGSHRDNNWKIGAKQGNLKNAKPIGPGKNLKDIKGGNFY